MKLLTRSSAIRVRCFSLADGSRIWGRMLTATEMERLRVEARSEAGTDMERAENLFKIKHLQKSLTNWEGFSDELGKPIAFDAALIPELYDVNPTVMGTLFAMLSNEFFHISQAETKNFETGPSVPA